MVGGCVRDYILGIIPKDYDITTNALPDEIANVFKDYGILRHGEKYGTIGVGFENKFYEITTFRSEGSYNDNRHPGQVKFLNNLDDDLKRRDLTINAMAMDRFLKIYDPFGGKDDLKNKIIRSCGNANERIKEDALRILRAVRFANRFKFYIDEDLFDAISLNRDLLRNISKERIFSEFSSMLLDERPSYALRLMAESGVLKVLFPDLQKTVNYDQKTPYHDKTLFDHLICVMDNCPPKLHVRLAGLFHDISKPDTFSFGEDGRGHFFDHDLLGAKRAGEILRDYRASNELIKKVEILIREHMKVHSEMTDKALRRQIKRIGRENILDLYDLMYADCVCTRIDRDGSFILKRKNRILVLLDERDMQKEKFLEINGNDLLALNFKGREIGQILSDLEAEVLDNPSLNTREKLLEIVKNKYKSGDDIG
ncbi:HDIG domain-containing metalloprotein [uncultured Peptoniphilus sp.]|uniref:CCA tRNA nucleotidyltransferase n=1 Tax=uncultured Peptoniphilus sp. TaxID=254354 RepID=UPI0028046404|nr:HDIG domain-containing metalloprotein [uncultured Peptoniphilus sp.]